ncbi:TlpA family protein disulfide reductase [Owenweeksia hongkongensis]|uniref:Thioredoxin domain-containing protein n=1 Tax=Owenweeksia hongkongensis (strain DSM 17368 / CIP 108786 / JCM 12287 / NRRL B-23963 / UST20020801) TaxID=926562 RepID=G8R8Z6_OWEHD|nr:hypothetical protein [Owenweeksia hongkongensis]AEV33604.1 hypothetical protein Oweho_2640 [Owenweeksia hongkongensis DSM 17368]
MKLPLLKDLSLVYAFLATSLILQSCGPDEPKMKAYEGEIASEIYLSENITEKDYIIIYGWTIWCGPCRNTIKEKLPILQSYLDSTGVSVGLMAICADDRTSKSFFELNDFMKESNIKSYFLETGTFSLHDRWALNSYFGNVLNSYEDNEGVPIVLVVDKKGDVIMQDRWVVASPERWREVVTILSKKA